MKPPKASPALAAKKCIHSIITSTLAFAPCLHIVYPKTMSISQQQPQLWQNDPNNLVFADLCNALYERELKKLAKEPNIQLNNLQKRIASLPFYIKRASERIIDFGSPLDLDSQNASWVYRQPKECPGPKQKDAEISKFYQAQQKFALIVPIYIENSGVEKLLLDSIDGLKDGNIHTNEHGWFNINGDAMDQSDHHKRLLKPTKVTMTCACSGHRWANQKRTSARALSLREMLLATNINWNHFGKLTERSKN